MLEIVLTGDVCSLFGGILVLLFLGNLLADTRQKRAGVVLAVLGFLAFLAFAWGQTPPHNADRLFNLLRSLLASGFTLGMAWLVLPLVMGVWQFLKLAQAASLASAQEWERKERARIAAERGTAGDGGGGEKQADAGAEQAKKAAEELAKQEAEAGHTAKAEAERRRQEADLRSEKGKAREHLREFYGRNEPLLEAAYTRSELEAFVAADMHDGLELPALWGVCLKKLAELRTLADRQREKERKEEGRRAVRNLRLKKLDAEIEACREKIANAERTQQDSDLLEDEKRGLVLKIRELEHQKESLNTLQEGDEP